MDSFDWGAVSAVAEVLGLVLIGASLIFVGFQIRQSALEARVASVQNVMSGWTEFYQRVSENDQLSSIVFRGIRDISSLDDYERWRLTMVLSGHFRAWHNAWYQWNVGISEGDSWESQIRVIRSFLAMPGAKEIWNERKWTLPESFSSYIDEQIASKGPDPRFKWSNGGTAA